MLILVRHGETDWSSSGRHTGLTDIGLTELGRSQADELKSMLSGYDFEQVITSPLIRAKETCERAGLGDRAEIVADAVEWDYGAYEGVKTSETRQDIPLWSVWTHEIIDGERLEHVGDRADKIIERAESVEGDTVVFAHGHLLRILGARWMGMAAAGGAHLVLAAASLCILGYERENRAILQWNETCHLRGHDPDM